MDARDDTVALQALLAARAAFLGYLERKVGDPALAEDLLQDTFTKLVARPDLAPEGEAVVPWFYRALSNAAIDQYRRRGAASRAYEAFARELDGHDAPSAEVQQEICACVSRLAMTLKPEYADALRTVELDGVPVGAYARQSGLTPGNAAVRVFRARRALRKRLTETCGACAEHGCLDCGCRTT
ncbi:MAG: sigma-70 family RNA polymerase sigma factor [Vicinamibacterales bacterium]